MLMAAALCAMAAGVAVVWHARAGGPAKMAQRAPGDAEPAPSLDGEVAAARFREPGEDTAPASLAKPVGATPARAIPRAFRLADQLNAPACEGVRVTSLSTDEGITIAGITRSEDGAHTWVGPGDRVGDLEVVHSGHDAALGASGVWLRRRVPGQDDAYCRAPLGMDPGEAAGHRTPSPSPVHPDRTASLAPPGEPSPSSPEDCSAR